MPNLLIIDNAIIAFEVLHRIQKLIHGGDDLIAIKLDMNKTYDRVD